MDNVTNSPNENESAVKSLIGPELSGNRVVVEGRIIPLLTCRDLGHDISFTLDDRFNIQVPRECAVEVSWLLAQALAIGQGYSHVGAETKGTPFAPRYSLVGEQG